MAGWEVPDNDVVAFPLQSQIFDTDFDVLTAGVAGRSVVSGCAVTAQGTPDMTVAVAAGRVRTGAGAPVEVSADASLAVDAADATLWRLDLVSAASDGTVTYTAGTAAALAAVKPPALPAGHVALAFVTVPPAATEIDSDQIVDKRVLAPAGSGWFNVRDYGATGDGSTDDTTAISDAIAALPATGGTVYFPAGTYKIVSTISISTPNVVLLGEGPEFGPSVVSMATANTGAFDFPTDPSGTADMNPPLIRGLHVTGPGSATSGDGIYAKGDLILENVMVDGFYNGVHLGSSSWHARLSGCFFTNNANAGVLLEAGSNNCLIQKCRFYGHTGWTYYGDQDYGVYYSGSVTAGISHRIVDSVLEQHQVAAIYLDGTTGAVIRGCYFETAYGTSYVSLGAAHVTYSTTIDGCYMQGWNASFWAIDGNYATGVTITGCDIGRYGGAGSFGAIRCDVTHGSGFLLVNNSIAFGTVQLANNCAQSPDLLQLKLYKAGTDSTLSDVSTNTLTDMDATNAAVTFIAPPSGCVLVRASAWAGHDGGVTGNVYWGLREGSSTIAQVQAFAQTLATAPVYLYLSVTFAVSGLTPGSSHTYKLAQRATAGHGYVQTGPTNGHLVMEVRQAPY